MITKEERAELRALAEDATIGKPNGAASFVEDFESDEHHKLLNDVVAWQFEAKSMHAGDFQFFLHFSPKKCLELLDALEAAEASLDRANKRYKAELDMLHERCRYSEYDLYQNTSPARIAARERQDRRDTELALDALRVDMTAQVKFVERQRDVLADVLESTGGEFACCIGCPFPEKREAKCKDAEEDYPPKQCWIEWAHQQARGEEKQ